MPAVVGIMLVGLVLSRIYSPDEAEQPAERISARQAGNYIGEQAEVCGRIASTSYRSDIGGEPTFLNFERPHPDAVFTVVIWGDNRTKWDSPPEQLYAERQICARGEIEEHQGTPQIEVRDPDQIHIER